MPGYVFFLLVVGIEHFGTEPALREFNVTQLHVLGSFDARAEQQVAMVAFQVRDVVVVDVLAYFLETDAFGFAEHAGVGGGHK